LLAEQRARVQLIRPKMSPLGWRHDAHEINNLLQAMTSRMTSARKWTAAAPRELIAHLVIEQGGRIRIVRRMRLLPAGMRAAGTHRPGAVSRGAGLTEAVTAQHHRGAGGLGQRRSSGQSDHLKQVF
jgi:hypothetical protein